MSENPYLLRERAHLRYGLSSMALHSDLVLDHGRGVWLYDSDGKQYMDLFAGAGIASLGHAHPTFLRAVYRQLDRLIVSSYTTRERAEYLEALTALLPKELNHVSFFSTGSEANEAALRVAKNYTNNFEVVSFWGGYHGKTAGAIGLSDLTIERSGIPQLPGLIKVPYPNRYRKLVPLENDDQYLDWHMSFVKQMIEKSSSNGVAAVIVEPMQGTAGNIIPVPGFLGRLRVLCDEIGALLILDEVITGFGRTGSMFAFEHEGIIPDILVIGKGMGNGIPLSAVITNDTVAMAYPTQIPSSMSSSFGGNPLSIVAAHATLNVLRDEKLIERANLIGKLWLDLMHHVLADYEFVGDIRGIGLLIGIELVKQRETKEPLDKQLTKQLFLKGIEHGLIASLQSPCIRINPPLIFTEEDVDIATAKLKLCFDWLRDNIKAGDNKRLF